MTITPFSPRIIGQVPNTNAIVDLYPGQTASFRPELPNQSRPSLAAVIQTANGENAAYYVDKGESLDRLMLIDMRSTPESARAGYKQFGDALVASSGSYLLLDPVNYDISRESGFKVLRPGERFVYGRPTYEMPRDDKRHRFSGASAVTSRTHFEIKISEDDEVTVQDLGSSNGTMVLRGQQAEVALAESERPLVNLAWVSRLGELTTTKTFEELSQTIPLQSKNLDPETAALKMPTWLNYAKARQIETDELWREAGNGGEPIDRQYVETYQFARKKIVDAFQDGSLYKTTDSFTQTIKDVHRLIGLRGDYNRLNGHDGRRVDYHECGAFRPLFNERLNNGRLPESLRAAAIANKYGDPYGANNRFVFGEPLSENTSYVRLNGISEEYLPYDVVRYDEHGVIKPAAYPYKKSGYQFHYANSLAIPEFMSQMHKKGQEILEATAQPNFDKDKVVELIAEQYQYGANARPFTQINNSIFMELANAQIKLIGFDGVTHGNMDTIAQRLQPEAFVKYFSARVNREEL